MMLCGWVGVYIPTLEEANEEALTSQVAQAPSQNIAYISYADLERNAVATMPFMSTDAGLVVHVYEVFFQNGKKKNSSFLFLFFFFLFFLFFLLPSGPWPAV